VGEALLNDGMALVLFEALITPEYDTSLKILYYFIRVIFISPLLGLVMGLGKGIDLPVSAQLLAYLEPKNDLLFCFKILDLRFHTINTCKRELVIGCL
jgi:hypothetical protein